MFLLSYTPILAQTGSMRRLDHAELEFGILAFISVISMGYPAVRWLFAMIGAFFAV